MKKHYYLLLSTFITLFLASCTSDPGYDYEIEPENESVDFTISIEQAEAELLSILTDMELSQHPTRSGGERRISGRFSLGSPAATRSDEAVEPYVHVFNFEDEEGFALMSGDERVPALLALTFGGSLHPESEVDDPGLALFLTNLEGYYEERTSAAGIIDPPKLPDPDDPNPDRSRVEYGPWQSLYTNPSMGKCVVKWSQSDPYNQYAPIIDGQHAPAGCAPVAVAQLMSMYRYPLSYNGHIFDWNEINNRPLSTSSKMQAARLIQQLGLPQNLDVAYALDESGASAGNIKRTLNNFGYTSNNVTSYNSNDIIRELNTGYPCLVGGYSIRVKEKFLGITIKTSYKKPHRWLVHGLLTRRRLVNYYGSDGRLSYSSYETAGNYLLCNWGWGANTGDGYYLAGVFDTNKGAVFSETRSGEPYNYQYELTMVTGIRK